MENYPVRVSGIGQFLPDCMADRKSRFCQIDNQPSPRSEVICPQPHRATRVPCLINTLTRVSSKTKGMKSIYRVDCAPEILDLLLNQDYDSDNDTFFAGSPPARTNNPVIQDSQFVKQSSAASLMNSPSANRGSPTCGSSFGGSPKVRIEGFACGSPEKHRVAAALA
ncbi:uncharacterized protein LOC121996418 [Zingiber officinale]|nr:uncharacterized protein LOC121992463 [Zingiber officinale]XP_042402807.1 uncharacterized protein LOC121992463 [Zingiber officinale]XP_042406326.1 uncharacterized protein LOC121996418 [Zingiber officinale]KAG6495702.1 hypothetical protein ZIOFF_043528 [Zingiber officinale]